jgi:hypothetical protein
MSSLAFAAPLATAARSVIPKATQQVISVDYRTLKASANALALKDKVLPPNMKEFETALRALGLDPDKDLESLTFATFHTDGGGLRMIGIAQGPIPAKAIQRRMFLKKVKPTTYQTAKLYPSAAGMKFAFLDDFTLLFGDDTSIKAALDARENSGESLAANARMTDLLASADQGPVWSVLDQEGTQNMMRSALGDASQLADFDNVKKRLMGSRYAMNFVSGMKFDLDVVTSDAMTAAALSSMVKAGVMYRRMTASGPDKAALENMSVDSDGNRLQVHFRADDNQFQSLLKSDMFAAVSK